MDALLAILGLASRLLGLAAWFDGRMKQRAAERQARAAADAPTTNQEWTDAAKKGDL